MKIADVTLTLFSWESIPPTIYGHHTARPTGKSDLGLLAVTTDEGVTGHAFLGTSSNPASLDGPGLIRFLKPILMNNFSMAIELKVMPVATEKFRSTDISGHYANFAQALGGYGERVTEPEEIVPAIRRGIQKTREGTPALLEFITEKAVDVSRFG